MKTLTTSKSTATQKCVAVSFYRISSDKQINDRQIQDVQKYCKAFDYNLVKEFEETVSGAAELSERTELRAFLEYVKSNPVEYVIVSELSRVGRSNLTLQIIETLTKLGICFISLKEGLKTLNSDGSINTTTQLIIDILNGINKFELETIRYRVKSGLRKTISKGTWSGGQVPFGYDLVDKKLIINSEADAIKFMFTKYAEGWGTSKIASHLNINKIYTKYGKQFTDVKVLKLLSNPIYTGKRMWNKETLDTPELRIVDDSIFTAVQNRIANKTNITDLNKHNKYNYLLVGKIRCSCGKSFIGQGRHNIYMCKSKKYSSGCNIKSVRINWLDTEITNHLKDHAKLLWDYSGIVNKTKEMQDEILTLQVQIDNEKVHQNYLINNISKIGQQIFDKKYDDSTELVDRLQKQIDNLNIKLSNTTRIFEDQELIRSGEITGYGILKRMYVDNEMIKKVIERVDIDNDNILVSLVNGKTFNIERENKFSKK